MKKRKGVLLAALCLTCSLACPGQHSFSNCSAAFLNNRMVVDRYATDGICKLASTATGKLTLQTISLSATEQKGLKKLPFSVAIRDGATKTLFLFSKKEVTQIDVANVLTKCRQGDSIVLMTLDRQYALPHNEILVQ